MRSCATIVARAVYPSRMITFTAECLHRLRPCRDTRLNNAAWRAACDAGVALHRPTHRGCRAGAHKQRNIPVVVMSRPTTAIPLKVTPGRTALPASSLRNNLVQTVNRSNLISVTLRQHCMTNALRAAVLNTRLACELDKCQQIKDLITENQLDICSLTET